MVTRTEGREVPSVVRTNVAVPGLDVVLRSRAGLAGLLVDELGSVGLRATMTGGAPSCGIRCVQTQEKTGRSGVKTGRSWNSPTAAAGIAFFGSRDVMKSA